MVVGVDPLTHMIGSPFEVLAEIPAMPFEEYGVRLAPMAVDRMVTNWIAAGTVRPLRMIAAVRKVAIEQLGFNDFQTGMDRPPAVERVRHCRGLFTVDSAQDSGPGRPWCVVWGPLVRNNPQAHEVTVWVATHSHHLQTRRISDSGCVL